MLRGLNSLLVRACTCIWSFREDVDRSFPSRVLAVDWSSYRTAYGRATEIPRYLVTLAQRRGHDNAMSQLSNHLCHQDGYVTDASAQALPFFLELLDCNDPKLVSAILHLLDSYAHCTNPYHPYNADRGEYAGFETEIYRGLLDSHERFRKLADHRDLSIAGSARSLIKELTITNRTE